MGTHTHDGLGRKLFKTAITLAVAPALALSQSVLIFYVLHQDRKHAKEDSRIDFSNAHDGKRFNEPIVQNTIHDLFSTGIQRKMPGVYAATRDRRGVLERESAVQDELRSSPPYGSQQNIALTAMP